MRIWKIAVPLVVVALFAAAIGWCWFVQMKTKEYLANMKQPPSPVVTKTVKKEKWQEVISAIGYIEPNQGIDISSESSGSIMELFFDSGDVVKQGQILVQVNDSVERANYESSKAQVEAAKKKYVRYSTLFNKGNISQQDLDNALADYEALSADVDAIKAKLDKLQIKAPFSGKLGIRNVYVGQYLQPGSKIAHLEDNSQVKVRFTIPQNDVQKIKLDEEVSITVDSYPGEVFQGKITAIEVVMNYESGLIQVQGTIPNPQSKLITGMYVKVNVILPEEEMQIAVPKTAVAYNLYGTSVYRVKTNDKGEKVSELVNVKINDISFSDRTIRILGKGDKERIVVYGVNTDKVLEDYIGRGRRQIDIHNSPYLFLNKDGNKLSQRYVRKITNR